MAASDDRWFTAHPLKVALGIAGLARDGINKLGQAASGEPNTEFHSPNVLPEGPWQQCWEWDHRASQHFVRRLFSSCTTYNLLTCAFEKLTEPPQELNGATARVSASKCTNPWYISEGTEASFLDAFSKFWQYRRWERQLTKMPGIRNQKLKTCLQCLGIRLLKMPRAPVSSHYCSSDPPSNVAEMEVAACFPESNQNEGPSATLQRRYEWVQNLASSTHYATMQSKYTTSDSQHGKDMYIGQAVLLSAICVSRIKGKRLAPCCPLGPTGRRAESNHVWLLRPPNKCVQCEWKTSL